MVPAANVPMLSAVNVPEALMLLDADRPDRVASVDCVGIGVCCGQDVPMLTETGVLAVKPGSVAKA